MIPKLRGVRAEHLELLAHAVHTRMGASRCGDREQQAAQEEQTAGQTPQETPNR